MDTAARRSLRRNVLVPGVLQFDHDQGKAVDEQHYIGASIIALLDYRELVHRQPVVGIHIVEVD